MSPKETLAFPIRPTPVEQLASIQQRYFASADAESRVELINEISEWENADAVDALGRLFQNERDPDLQLALLGAVMVQDQDAAAQLTVFAGGLWPFQPQSVRHLAIAGLAALGTPGARQMLEGLRFDADREIRAAAAEALAR